MKLSKVLMTVAAAAAVIGLVGCKLSEDDEKAINGENISFTHDGSKSYYRSFKATATKHYSANAEITIEEPKNLTDATTNGVKSKAGLGFVFGLEKESKEKISSTSSTEKKTYDFYKFGIASVRYNKDTSKVEWYVSWCENVPNTVFGYNDATTFNAELIDGNSYGTEVQIVPTTGYWKATDMTLGSINNVECLRAIIKVTANADGSYKVTLCDYAGVEKDSCTIPASKTGLTAKTQKLIGRYLTVYKNQTVKGKIVYTDVSGNLIPADYDVIEE